MSDFKSLYNGNELNTRASLQESYSSRDLKEWLVQIYQFSPSHSVLDLGCGFGKDLCMFSPFIKKGTGVDSSAHLIQTAREKVRQLSISNLSFECCDVNAYCEPATLYDRIISNFAFYYFDVKKVIHNMSVMLDAKGKIFIGGSPDHNAPELNELIASFLTAEELPRTYAAGFSDVRKYADIFKEYFGVVRFHQFVNVVKFPTASIFIDYLKSTTLVQGLPHDRARQFLDDAENVLKQKKYPYLTKIVDVLEVSH
jgi:cyclopropane fatty-acyl-phospholipid synthase-like methyltransferase